MKCVICKTGEGTKSLVQVEVKVGYDHEGGAEQTCAPAHNGRDDPCPDMARGTVGTGT
jgi:hypothetical protein